MIDYRIQKSCSNCVYCFLYSDYDDGGEYYCNIENNRPLCGSVSLNEDFYEINECKTEEEYRKQNEEGYKKLRIWNDWSIENRVDSNGICNNYKINSEHFKDFFGTYNLGKKYINVSFKLMNEMIKRLDTFDMNHVIGMLK